MGGYIKRKYLSLRPIVSLLFLLFGLYFAKYFDLELTQDQSFLIFGEYAGHSGSDIVAEEIG